MNYRLIARLKFLKNIYYLNASAKFFYKNLQYYFSRKGVLLNLKMIVILDVSGFKHDTVTVLFPTLILFVQAKDFTGQKVILIG